MSVRHRFQKAIDAGAQVNVATVAVFELWYGVEKSEHKEANTSLSSAKIPSAQQFHSTQLVCGILAHVIRQYFLRLGGRSGFRVPQPTNIVVTRCRESVSA